MNWEAVGAVGEIAGAITVLITLIYLALQVRQNTNQLQDTAMQASMKDWNTLRAAQLGSRDVAELWVKGLNNLTSLDETDRYRFVQGIHIQMTATFGLDRRINVGSFEGYDSSTIDDWLERMVRFPGIRTVWAEIGSGYPKSFQDKVSKAMRKTAGANEA